MSYYLRVENLGAGPPCKACAYTHVDGVKDGGIPTGQGSGVGDVVLWMDNPTFNPSPQYHCGIVTAVLCTDPIDPMDPPCDWENGNHWGVVILNIGAGDTLPNCLACDVACEAMGSSCPTCGTATTTSAPGGTTTTQFPGGGTTTCAPSLISPYTAFKIAENGECECPCDCSGGGTSTTSGPGGGSTTTGPGGSCCEGKTVMEATQCTGGGDYDFALGFTYICDVGHINSPPSPLGITTGDFVIGKFCDDENTMACMKITNHEHQPFATPLWESYASCSLSNMNGPCHCTNCGT